MKFVLILSASSVWLRNQIPPSVMCVFVWLMAFLHAYAITISLQDWCRVIVNKVTITYSTCLCYLKRKEEKRTNKPNESTWLSLPLPFHLVFWMYYINIVSVYRLVRSSHELTWMFIAFKMGNDKRENFI